MATYTDPTQGILVVSEACDGSGNIRMGLYGGKCNGVTANVITLYSVHASVRTEEANSGYLGSTWDNTGHWLYLDGPAYPYATDISYLIEWSIAWAGPGHHEWGYADNFTSWHKPSAASNPTVDHNNFHYGEYSTINLSESGGGTGGEPGTALIYFGTSNKGDVIGTGSPLNITAPGIGTTRYYTWWQNSCGIQTSDAGYLDVTVLAKVKRNRGTGIITFQ